MTMMVDTLYAGPADDPDRYRLGDPIGAGAEGALYRGYLPMASGPVLDVAIKMLHPQHQPQLASWRRHWGEQVELLRSLQAQGLVTVRDGFVGALPHAAAASGSGETLYLVMNFLDGVALDRWADDNPGVSDRDKLRLLLPVAAGLDLMHSGVATGSVPVIHGDIKPANVLVTGQDRSVLVDFGMMRSLPDGVRTTSVTGTMGYMAPEVISDGLYTPAADRYAFGGVAYHLLTGQHPSRDLVAMRAALETGGRDPEVVAHVLRMFGTAESRPAPLANWCAQLRDSSLDLRDDVQNLPPAAPGRFHRPPPLAAGQRPPEPLRNRRSPRWLIGALIAAIVVLGTGFRTVVESTPSAPAAPITLAFPPAVYPSGLVAAREWSLTGRRGTNVHARLRVTNGSTGIVNSSVDEVIPKSLASTTASIRFLPPPDQVIRRDPVVRYTIRDLEPTHAVDLVYDIAVAPDGARISRLQDWAMAQAADQSAYLAAASSDMVPVTLSHLSVTPARVSLIEGRMYQLSPAGTMSDGSAAPALALNNLVWRSSDPSVIGVSDGRITANGAGRATVSAQTGSLRAEVVITVTTPESSAPAVLQTPTYEPPAVTVNPPPPAAVTTTLPAEVTTTTATTTRPTTTTTIPPITTTTVPTTTTTTTTPPTTTTTEPATTTTTTTTPPTTTTTTA